MQIDKQLIEERKAQAIRQITAGAYLQQIRVNRNLRLIDVSENVNISPTYLSEIEKGKKVPSDVAIRELAEFYEVDESEIFDLFGKIPLSVKEELQDNKELSQTIMAIRKDKKMTEDEKQELYDHFFRMYKKYVKEKH